MFRSIMNAFLKREDCPSSFELVAFQKGQLSREHGVDVRHHLASCDFCDAEEGFYEHYPLVEFQIEKAPAIPAPLYELAEALLKRKHGDATTLNLLLKEKDGLALTPSV
jgi:hypothetical protein